MPTPIQPGPRRTVLVLNRYQDMMDLMRMVIEDEGFAAATAPKFSTNTTSRSKAFGVS